jgi:VCBS repeat-containing protein
MTTHVFIDDSTSFLSDLAPPDPFSDKLSSVLASGKSSSALGSHASPWRAESDSITANLLGDDADLFGTRDAAVLSYYIGLSKPLTLSSQPQFGGSDSGGVFAALVTTPPLSTVHADGLAAMPAQYVSTPSTNVPTILLSADLPPSFATSSNPTITARTIQTASTTPIVITTIQQLDSIGIDPSMPLDGNYVLGNDINASGLTFTTIGAASNDPFTGTLNGSGHSIEGLVDAGGLFLAIAGTVENITLVDPTITGNASLSNGVQDPAVGALGYTVTNGGIVYRVGVSGGSVSGTNFVGGLIGYNAGGIITQSFSTASVTINNGGYAGGLVGENDGAVSTSYSTGSVTGSPGAAIGGLAGVNSFDYVTVGGSIVQSYSAGRVSGGLEAGGLAGANQNPIMNSVWDTQASGQTSAVGLTAYNGSLTSVAGLATTQLQSGTLPAGFDPTVWGAAPGVYPYLLWQVANSPPTASPDVVPVEQGYTLTVAAPGILAEASDPDGDVLTVSAIATASGVQGTLAQPLRGTYGSLTMNSDGSYTYKETQPLGAAVANGGAFDTFTYTVSDGRGATAQSTLSIDIYQTKPPPTAGSLSTDLAAAEAKIQDELAAGIPYSQAVHLTDLSDPTDGNLVGHIVADVATQFDSQANYYKDALGYINPNNVVKGDEAYDQCVALVFGLDKNLPELTGQWTNGSEQIDVNGNANPAISPGAAIPIATFLTPADTVPQNPGTGRYPTTNEHAAFFLGYGIEANHPGFFMLDQYLPQTGDPGIPGEPAEVRFYAFDRSLVAPEYFNIVPSASHILVS